jgi:hypothetical protein
MDIEAKIPQQNTSKPNPEKYKRFIYHNQVGFISEIQS